MANFYNLDSLLVGKPTLTLVTGRATETLVFKLNSNASNIMLIRHFYLGAVKFLGFQELFLTVKTFKRFFK
jgi:hypothetical protein